MLQQPRIDRSRFVSGSDVRDALRRVEHREEVCLAAHRLERLDAFDEIGERRRPSRLHRRGDLVVGKVVLRRFEKRANALGEELQQIGLDALRVAAAVGRTGDVDQPIDSHPHLPLVAIEQDLHEPLRRATEAERISRSGRLEADSKETDERLDLVGDRYDCAAPCSRQLVVNIQRQIVIVDRLPHAVGLSFLARVDAADLSLQIGELLHHLGDEIGFAQSSGRDDIAVIDFQLRTDRRGDPLDPFRLLQVVAELFLELQMGELLETVGERLAPVGLVEERRVRESRVRDEGVAVSRVAIGIGLVVDHGEKRIRQLSRLTPDRELLLMDAHHGDEYFFGQRQVLLPKLRAQHARILRQVLPLRPDRGVR